MSIPILANALPGGVEEAITFIEKAAQGNSDIVGEEAMSFKETIDTRMEEVNARPVEAGILLEETHLVRPVQLEIDSEVDQKGKPQALSSRQVMSPVLSKEQAVEKPSHLA